MGLKRLPALSVPEDAAPAGASFVSGRELFARKAVCRDAALSPCISRGETWSRNGTSQTPHRAAPLRWQAEGERFRYSRAASAIIACRAPAAHGSVFIAPLTEGRAKGARCDLTGSQRGCN